MKDCGYPWQDLNLQAFRHQNLNLAWMPISPHGRLSRSDRNRTHVCCFGDSRSTTELQTYIDPLLKLNIWCITILRSITGIVQISEARPITSEADCCLFIWTVKPLQTCSCASAFLHRWSSWFFDRSNVKCLLPNCAFQLSPRVSILRRTTHSDRESSPHTLQVCMRSD